MSAGSQTLETFDGRGASTSLAGPQGRRLSVVGSLTTQKLALLSIAYLVLLVAVAILAPWVAPFDPADQSLMMRNQPPMSEPESGGRVPHLLGTDFLGRDQLSRMLFGARISLLVAVSGVGLSGIIGTAAGLLSGYRRGWLDEIIMRLVDLQMSFPVLLIALIVLYVLGPGLWNLVLVLAISRWVIYARLTRAIVLSDREQVYIDAARVNGATTGRILVRHLMPNLIPSLIVLATLEAASLMLAEATLSFLGLGLPLAEPSWGQMLATGRPYIATAWWLIAFPGLAIFVTVGSLNIAGQWAKQLVDPLSRP